MPDSNETVGVNFQVSGVREVAQAYRTVEQTLDRLERLATERDRRGGAARVGIAKRTAKTIIDEERSAGQKLTRIEAELLSKQVATANARAELEKRMARKRMDANLDLYKELERKEKEHTRLVEQEAKKRGDIEKAAAKRREQFGKTIGGIVGGSVRSNVSRFASYGGMAIAAGGGFAIADAMRGYASSEAAAINLANSMFNPNDPEQQAFLKKSGRDRFGKKDIMSFANQASNVSGVDKTQLLQGWQDYIAKSSDWKALATQEGQGTLVDLAKMSKATGTDFGKLMSAAGSLRVQNPNLDPAKMMEMMRAIVGQGKMGAVEMKDLAEHSAVITSGAGKYKIGAGGYKDQAEAQAALLGLSQVAIRTSGSAAEAATSVKSFGADLGAKADKAQASFAGLKLKDDKGALLKASDIVENVFAATKGDTTKMGEGKGHIGMGRESIRIMEALKTQYDIAYSEAKAKNPKIKDAEAVKIAAKAAGDEVRKFERAGYKQEDIDRDFKEVTEGAGQRIEMASQRIRNALEVKLAPVVERLADTFTKNEHSLDRLVDGVGKAAEFMLENPFKGIGLIVAAGVAKDVAAAGLGAAVNKALTTQIAGGFKGGITLGGGLAIASAAIAIEQAGEVAINNLLDKKSKQMQSGVDTDTALTNQTTELLQKARSGKLSKKDLAEARATLAAAQGNVAEQQAALDPEKRSLLTKGLMGLSYAFGGKEGREAMFHEEDQRRATLERTTKNFEQLSKTVQMLDKHLAAIADTAGKADPNHPARNVPISHAARGGDH